jgi:hypothetical protein
VPVEEGPACSMGVYTEGGVAAAGVVFGTIEHVDVAVADEAAGLKVWMDSHWTAVWAMGSTKTEALFRLMTGALTRRVKGRSCQCGFAATSKDAERSPTQARRGRLICMTDPVTA